MGSWVSPPDNFEITTARRWILLYLTLKIQHYQCASFHAQTSEGNWSQSTDAMMNTIMIVTWEWCTSSSDGCYYQPPFQLGNSEKWVWLANNNDTQCHSSVTAQYIAFTQTLVNVFSVLTKGNKIILWLDFGRQNRLDKWFEMTTFFAVPCKTESRASDRLDWC